MIYPAFPIYALCDFYIGFHNPHCFYNVFLYLLSLLSPICSTIMVRFFGNCNLILSHLSECHGNTGNSVLVGSALQTGEDGKVDFLLKVVLDLLARLVMALGALAVKDQTRPAKYTYHS